VENNGGRRRRHVRWERVLDVADLAREGGREGGREGERGEWVEV
jgi:hypothetical protein